MENKMSMPSMHICLGYVREDSIKGSQKCNKGIENSPALILD